MAKAINHFSRMGNDGYEYAMRADGVWFLRQGYFGNYGWAKTKWSEVVGGEEAFVVINECLKAQATGETCTHVGFGNLVIFTDGKGLRLPN